MEKRRLELIAEIQDETETAIVLLDFFENRRRIPELKREKQLVRNAIKPKLEEAMKKSLTPEKKHEIRLYWERVNSITL